MPYDYQSIADAAKAALKEAFPESAIETEKGFEGRVHIKIISPALNGRSERAKQALVFEVLQDRLGADVQAVSLVVPYGMDELP